MSLPVVECRSLVEFCRAYEQHRTAAANNRSSPRSNPNRKKLSPQQDEALFESICDQSPLTAAIDVVLFLLVIGAIGILTGPYFTLLFNEAVEVFIELGFVIADLADAVPQVYAITFCLGFCAAVVVWIGLSLRSRKCGRPFCKGLKKAVEFDIQLETEQCVKCYPPMPTSDQGFGVKAVELGEDQKELEAELRKMAPMNGRTVLIFRAPCGCPTGRMEVWGAKKFRRIKK